MRRSLLGLLFSALSVFAIAEARADSTVPALSAGTSLTSAVMYAANAGANDNKLGFTTTVFDISAGALTLKAGGVTNAMLANSATTVLGTVCTLGSTCTPSVPAASVSVGALANGMTATTQTLGDNSTKLATTAFVIANAGSGGGAPGGTSGQTQYNNAGSFGGYTMGGDATINTTTGVLTIASNAITTTKINNAAVTLAKQATNTANTLQGFDNSGNAADVVVGTGLTLSAGTLTSTGAVANPTATAGPTAINGSASTAMRSDGAPAIQKGTNAQFGIVEGDNATITCVLGVCSTIGGGSAGGGVDGGTNFVTVTGTGAISGTPNLVYIGSGWATGTLTLPQISALANPNDHLVCIDDSKIFVDGTHTLTIIPNATTPDTIANASSTGAITTSGLSMCFRPNNTTHNWTVETTTTIPNPTNGTILTGTGTTPGSAAWATAIPNGVTATTQSAASNDTKVATNAYADRVGASLTYSMSIGWIPTVNPNNTILGVFPANATVTSIVGAVETATGGTATVTVNKAGSGTACSGGTALHSGSFNANGTAATNQTLTVTSGAITSAQRLCLQTTGSTSWTGGTGSGAITVNYTIP